MIKKYIFVSSGAARVWLLRSQVLSCGQNHLIPLCSLVWAFHQLQRLSTQRNKCAKGPKPSQVWTMCEAPKFTFVSPETGTEHSQLDRNKWQYPHLHLCLFVCQTQVLVYWPFLTSCSNGNGCISFKHVETCIFVLIWMKILSLKHFSILSYLEQHHLRLVALQRYFTRTGHYFHGWLQSRINPKNTVNVDILPF